MTTKEDLIRNIYRDCQKGRIEIDEAVEKAVNETAERIFSEIFSASQTKWTYLCETKSFIDVNFIKILKERWLGVEK